MEMDSLELDGNGECGIEDTSSDPFPSSGSPDISDIFGDPQIHPRVGDQYQVAVPPLLKGSHGPKVNILVDEQLTVDTAHFFLLGLSIPIMWVYGQIENIKVEGKNLKLEEQNFLPRPNDRGDANETEDTQNNKSCRTSDNILSKPKVEALDVAYEKSSGRLPNGEVVVSNHMDAGSSLKQREQYNLNQNFIGKGLYPVPGSLGNSWNAIEMESFLLGLYIFGKNLVQVQRFVESKELGDILSYYYGKFYRSDGYCRWSECRKIRSRKCIHGQRIFTGWRQQELLSRLRPSLIEESQNSLLEMSKAFGEGKISLEDYVFTLRATVGMETLIEAVGIGKGKKDITGFLDPIRTNQVISTRQEIPSGKECNSLTSGDIVKFLTGDFRLSKARSNDLFWEAVWPRLLARGWHSEQPKRQKFVASKNSLVFLIPGIKKFSRRRLVKGNHYFDSVSDVLSKVLLDPKLLDVEVETPGDNVTKEHVSDTERMVDQKGPSDHQRPCYLRPRISNSTSDFMKFTVVDTSLVHGEEPFKMRELRNLPVNTNTTFTQTSNSRTDVNESSEVPMDKLDSAVMLLRHQEETTTSRPTNVMLDRTILSELSDSLVSISKHATLIDSLDTSNVMMENHDEKYPDLCNENHVKKTSNCQARQRAKRVRTNFASPFMKRRRLTACGRADASRGTNSLYVGSRLKEEESCGIQDLPDISDNLDGAAGPSQEKVPSSSSAKASSENSSEDILTECVSIRVSCHENVEPRTLIDLNLPHVPPDFGAGEVFITEVVESQDDQSAKDSCFPSETSQPEDSQPVRTSDGVVSAEEHTNDNGRRQSTRNRPLTTKALEALACGYLNTKRKWRGSEPTARDSSLARPSRRTRGKVSMPTSLDSVATGNMDSKVDEGFEEVSSSNTNSPSNTLADSERNASHVLLRIPQPAYHSELLAGKNKQPG